MQLQTFEQPHKIRYSGALLGIVKRASDLSHEAEAQAILTVFFLVFVGDTASLCTGICVKFIFGCFL